MIKAVNSNPPGLSHAKRSSYNQDVAGLVELIGLMIRPGSSSAPND
jgi:hypothetical protein